MKGALEGAREELRAAVAEETRLTAKCRGLEESALRQVEYLEQVHGTEAKDLLQRLQVPPGPNAHERDGNVYMGCDKERP